MQRISLDGAWTLTFFPEGERAVSRPAHLEGCGAPSIEAVVPGNVELDLTRAGVLPDLFYGDNIFLLRQWEGHEWWYCRSFPTPEGIAGKRVDLVFSGLDCFATIWLNGIEIGRTANMFVEHRFSVAEFLRPEGDNDLVVRLGSAVNAARGHRIEPSETAMEVNWEQLAVRKAPHMYGWDIAPRAVSAGIWRPAALEIHEPTEIVGLYYWTDRIGKDDAVLGIQWQFQSDAASLEGFSLRFRGECGESQFECSAPARFVAGTAWAHVPGARLWWPKGYGEANLYTVTCDLLRDGQVVDTRTDRVGLRTAELVRTDLTTPEQPGEFLFRVNGEPIMCKGSNWVPADAFHSRDAERIPRILDLFADLGCNIVRCWGGNVYEDHLFFDLCDRHGIMVWQDFAFACARYPQDEGFLALVRAEAEQVVRKLRNHPSLVLWAGDNECDCAYGGMDPGQNRITREVLPQVVARCDPRRPYLPSSPYISPEVVRRGGDWNLMPEQHLWGPRDYFKGPFYTGEQAHFASEIGYHGCPGVSSIRRFLEPHYLWPWQDNPQWVTHCTDPVPGGGGYKYRAKLMADQVKALFGKAPERLEDFALASQISQAEAKKFFVERFRLRKWRKTGIIWWNVMDCWPQFSDAIVDYYFCRKLAYWYLRRSQQPICLMVDEPEAGAHRVAIGNDSLAPAQGEYTVRDADSNRVIMQGQYEVEANANADLGKVPVAGLGEHRLLLLEWTVGERRFGNHYVLGAAPLPLARYRQWLEAIGRLPDGFAADEIAR